MLEATLLEGVDPGQDVACQEAFGPVAILSKFDDFEAALDEVNDSVFGLQAGIFTREVDDLQFQCLGIDGRQSVGAQQGDPGVALRIHLDAVWPRALGLHRHQVYVAGAFVQTADGIAPLQREPDFVPAPEDQCMRVPRA